MNCMFDGENDDVMQIKEIDLSGNFNTVNVNNMTYMFSHCNNLEKIYVKESFDLSNTTDSDGMFASCTSLIGGNGTVFDSSHTNKEYARIDTAGLPGYFTRKTTTP